MEKKTAGSWLIHHSNKLQGVNNSLSFEKTLVAGKAGILLSAISADSERRISPDKLNALAKASNISVMLELPNLIRILKSNDYIDESRSGEVVALGVTSESILNHTADIFTKLAPEPIEFAAIDLAERASIAPVRASEIRSEIADARQLASAEMDQLFTESGDIGFVEQERLDSSETLLFNGNLFRREASEKLMLVLDSLGPKERELLSEFTEILKRKACIDVDRVKAMLGEPLFNKVCSIGLFDINIVNNNVSNTGFVTLPSAFSKFGSNSMVDDAFDLAKAFLSSVTYGITKSYHARGEIRMVDALLATLISGEPVGPVPAIGHDYKILELKGVVQVYMGEKKGRKGPMLRLLKKEIGELARKAIKEGDVSEHSLAVLPTATLTGYIGPEANRFAQRRKQLQTSPKATNDMLSALRTGAY